jgi:hypothetical protein
MWEPACWRGQSVKNAGAGRLQSRASSLPQWICISGKCGSQLAGEGSQSKMQGQVGCSREQSPSHRPSAGRRSCGRQLAGELARSGSRASITPSGHRERPSVVQLSAPSPASGAPPGWLPQDFSKDSRPETHGDPEAGRLQGRSGQTRKWLTIICNWPPRRASSTLEAAVSSLADAVCSETSRTLTMLRLISSATALCCSAAAAICWFMA